MLAALLLLAVQLALPLTRPAAWYNLRFCRPSARCMPPLGAGVLLHGGWPLGTVLA